MDNRPLGSIKIGRARGIVPIYGHLEIGPDNICPSLSALQQPSWVPKGPVYAQDVKVGYLERLAWNEANQRLQLFFHYDGDQDIWGEAEYMLAASQLAVDEIGCPICDSFYTIGGHSCECIRKAAVLQVRKIHVTSVRLFDMRHDHMMDLDARPMLLSRHFSGAIWALHHAEEL